MMTSNRNSSSSSSTMTKPRSRIDDEIGVETSSVAANSGMRVRNPSCSASSTLSSTSSSSSSTALSNNDAKHHHLHNNHHSGGDLIDVLVVYPNGFQTVKKLDMRKAIYDILIELAATGKLLPSNYTLKLFASTTHDDNNNNNNFNDDAIIEYTPNQTIGQLNPTKIKIIPKTSTLKHNFQNYELSSHHHNHLSSTLSNQLHSSSAAANSGSSRVQTLSNNYSSTPFELTNRVQVNLPFNQKTAVRVRLDISLDDLLSAICKEAALERARYDLVINGSRPNSMLDSLSTYNTKEVTLVLKHSETAYVKNSISSKGSHTSQNSTKSRTQAKISSQQQRTSPQIENSSPLNRSKSELDLSTSGSSNSSCQKDIDKRNPLSQKSHNSGSMFGFFTRKRHSKSKNSLCASHSNLAVTNSLETSAMTLSVAKSDEKEEKSYGKYSTSYVSNSSLSKTKKRVAPPPPTCTPKPTPTEKLSLPNDNSPEVSVTVSSRPKPDIIDNEMLEKIKQLTKKKQKKTAAPLPPQSLSPCSNSPSSQSSSHDINYSSPDHTNDAKTSATAKKLFLSMSESSSSPTTYPSPSLSDASSSLSNQDRANNNNSNNDKRIHISKISNSLVMPVMKTTANNSNDEEEKETGEVAIVKRNSSIQSSSESSEVADYTRKAADYKYRNDCESSVHDSSIASTNASSSNHTCNQSDMQSIQSIPSSIQRDHSTIEIVRNPPSGDNTQFEKSPPSQFNEPDLSLIVSNRSSFGRMKKNNGAVADAKIAFSSEENSNSSVLDDHHHFIQRQQSNEDEEAPKEEDEDQVEDELNHSITDSNNPHNLHLDTRIPNVFVSENENVHYREHLRTDFEQELADLSGLSGHNNEEEQRKPPTVTMSTPPKRCTAIIEVRPEYVQSSLIRISEPVAMTDVKIQKPLELSMTDSYHFDGQIVRQNISPRVLVESDQQHQQQNQQQSNGLKLRSPSSPLPQFPAICENEVNQTHGNYVVVRTGDIIEKNGIYYSSDGTIRGYSGTVKKMAGSKTLNEVFLKQQEIEQQHEKEYQIELDSKKRLQQIPEVSSSVSRKEDNKEKENQHPLPPPPAPPAPPVVVSPSINTNSPVFSGVQAAKQRLSLGNIIANEKKNYTLSSNSNIFKSAGTTPFRKYPQTINNNDSIENELTKKLENRRQQIANQMMTQQQKNETHLRIDTNIQAGKTTVAGSSLASSSNHSEESSSPMSSPSVNSPPKPAASFVMSAKYRTSYQQSFGSAKTAATATATIVAITRNEEMPLPPPPPPLPPSMFADSPPVVAPPPAPAPLPKPQTKSMTLPPAVAPKNFKPDTLVSISKKNQLLDARENLLESIKGFNFANLKKVHQSD